MKYLFKIIKALNENSSEKNELSDKALEILEQYYAIHHPIEYLLTQDEDDTD